MTKLSIIVVNWNTKDLLKKCLVSIDYKDCEVIVVDNGSTDGSKEYLRSLKLKAESLKLIFNNKNLGFAKANNQGIKVAQGEYILLLNSDAIAKKGAIEKLVNYLDTHKEIVAVSPVLLNSNGSKQVNYYMKFPNLWQIFLYHNIVLRPIVMKTPLKKLIVSSENKVDQLPGAAIMARKSVFEKTNGLDEDFTFLFEDVDWCYRVKKMGLGKLAVVSIAEITHLGGASWKKWLGKDRLGFYRQYFKSLMLFVKKHSPDKASSFKGALKITFIINTLVHVLILNWKKAKVQFKLFLTKL